jgi:hypothetical protein
MTISKNDPKASRHRKGARGYCCCAVSKSRKPRQNSARYPVNAGLDRLGRARLALSELVAIRETITLSEYFEDNRSGERFALRKTIPGAVWRYIASMSCSSRLCHPIPLADSRVLRTLAGKG